MAKMKLSGNETSAASIENNWRSWHLRENHAAYQQ